MGTFSLPMYRTCRPKLTITAFCCKKGMPVIIELDHRVRDMEMPKYPLHALHAAMVTNFHCLSSFWSPILQPADTGHIVLNIKIELGIKCPNPYEHWLCE